MASAVGWLQHRVWWLSRIEWMLVFAIIAVLVALLTPSVQWGGSGDIDLPIRVQVVDVAEGWPISKARVAIVNGPFPGYSTPDEFRGFFPRDVFSHLPSDKQGITDAEGTVTIRHEFQTEASHKQPEWHAYLRAWVIVQADAYGTVVVPVSHDVRKPTKQLRQQGELRVDVGLMKIHQNE